MKTYLFSIHGVSDSLEYRYHKAIEANSLMEAVGKLENILYPLYDDYSITGVFSE